MQKYFDVRNKRIILYRETTSTNQMARELAMNGAPEGTVVMATFQTSGKGRMDRVWHCPPARGIMISMVLLPDLDIQRLQGLTLLCSTAVVDAVKDATNCTADIKWPNDVLINGKKVCGVLAQSGLTSGSKRFVVMGVGLNVNQTVAELPDVCRETSTSLRIESGGRISRMGVLETFFCHWDRHYSAYAAKGYDYLRETVTL